MCRECKVEQGVQNRAGSARQSRECTGSAREGRECKIEQGVQYRDESARQRRECTGKGRARQNREECKTEQGLKYRAGSARSVRDWSCMVWRVGSVLSRK